MAFPEAVANTFDGIAIDKNTHLELWTGANYTGTKVVDITGPMVINNLIHGGLLTGSYSVGNCFGLIAATLSWTDCQVSDRNMNPWGSGSCKITCTTP